MGSTGKAMVDKNKHYSTAAVNQSVVGESSMLGLKG